MQSTLTKMRSKAGAAYKKTAKRVKTLQKSLKADLARVAKGQARVAKAVAKAEATQEAIVLALQEHNKNKATSDVLAEIIPLIKEGTPAPGKSVEATAKRGPGRPKKAEAEVAVAKRGPGRPKKDATTEAAPVKRGPGRPKKVQAETVTAAAPDAAAVPKRGPGRPKKVVVAEATATPEEAAVPATRGRKKANGAVSLPEAMVQVIGSDTMGPGEIVTALEQAGLLPASNNPKGYISSVLSTGSKGPKAIFENVSRGQYRVKGAPSKNVAAPMLPAIVVPAPIAAVPAAEPVEEVAESADDVLKALGMEDMSALA